MALEKSIRSMSDTVLTSGTRFQPSRLLFCCRGENLGKLCNFCDCLHDSLIRDRIVLGIKDE